MAGGMQGRGQHAWQGACKAGDSVHGRGHGVGGGAHVAVAGGMHGRGVHGRGVCGRGACVAGETATAAGSNTVRILLECILVFNV